MKDLSLRYPQGTVVEAVVTLVKFFEALVELDDGTTGFVRNRELSWGPEPDDAAEIIRKGDRISAIVLGIDRVKQRLKLSLRQAERDPWKDIGQRYKVGQVVRCKVTSLLGGVAFVELEPAVEGYIPLHEISWTWPIRMEELLWIGDTVDAIITGLHFKKRRASLSIRKHLTRLEDRSIRARYQRQHSPEVAGTGLPVSELISVEDRMALLTLARTHPSSNDAETPLVAESLSQRASRLKRILVADDDPSFKVSLQSLLQRLGHQVDVVDSAEEAVNRCATDEFDLVLMDVRFNQCKMSGLQATHDISSSAKDLPILIMTGLIGANSNGFAAQARKAGATGLLTKPIPLSSLTLRMALIADGKDCWDVETTASESNLHSHFGSALGPLARHVNFPEATSHELMKLQRETQASACILFHRALETRMVSVVAHTGAPLKSYDTNKYTLQATPIQEVIKQGSELLEEDVSRNPQRFKYLNLIDFASCIGLPLEMFGKRRYGIFLFHPDKGHFTSDHLKLAKVSASLIASIIDHSEVEQVVRRAQPLVFSGQIGSTLIHEINNRVGSVLNYAESLLVEHDTIEKDISAAFDLKLRDRMKGYIKNLESNARAMQQITSLYLGLMSLGTREVIRLNETVQRALSVLAPIAERHRVEIVTDFEPNLPSTIAVGSWLEQAFVNVTLNAIQHISLSKREGELLVQTKLSEGVDTLSLHVRFIDNGPGIHAQHLEHVFDLGFSTRTEGTGLGLFATRSLIEAMGGKVAVVSSVMFVGTTILIELPLVVPSVEESVHG